MKNNRPPDSASNSGVPSRIRTHDQMDKGPYPVRYMELVKNEGEKWARQDLNLQPAAWRITALFQFGYDLVLTIER